MKPGVIIRDERAYGVVSLIARSRARGAHVGRVLAGAATSGNGRLVSISPAAVQFASKALANRTHPSASGALGSKHPRFVPETDRKGPSAPLARGRGHPSVGRSRFSRCRPRRWLDKCSTFSTPPRATGTAKWNAKRSVTIVDGVVPEYLVAARRATDADAAAQFERNVRRMYDQMARIAIAPTWDRVLRLRRRAHAPTPAGARGEEPDDRSRPVRVSRHPITQRSAGEETRVRRDRERDSRARSKGSLDRHWCGRSSVSGHARSRHDPSHRLACDLCDAVVVRVVVQHGDPMLLRDRSDE